MRNDDNDKKTAKNEHLQITPIEELRLEKKRLREERDIAATPRLSATVLTILGIDAHQRSDLLGQDEIC